MDDLEGNAGDDQTAAQNAGQNAPDNGIQPFL